MGIARERRCGLSVPLKAPAQSVCLWLHSRIGRSDGEKSFCIWGRNRENIWMEVQRIQLTCIFHRQFISKGLAVFVRHGKRCAWEDEAKSDRKNRRTEVRLHSSSRAVFASKQLVTKETAMAQGEHRGKCVI
jgi:hypothetical protein